MTAIETLSHNNANDCNAAEDYKERRSAKRIVSVLMNAKISTGRQEGVCRILNVAESGLNIESAMKLSVGSCVRIELRSDLSVDGVVRWENRGIAGIAATRPIILEALLKRPAIQIQKEKPRQPRFRCTAIASIESGGRIFRCTVADISIRGARLEGIEKLRHGEILPLHIEHLTPHKVNVIWNRNCQAGVKLVNILSYGEMEAWLRHHGEEI